MMRGTTTVVKARLLLLGLDPDIVDYSKSPVPGTHHGKSPLCHRGRSRKSGSARLQREDAVRRRGQDCGSAACRHTRNWQI